MIDAIGTASNVSQQFEFVSVSTSAQGAQSGHETAELAQLADAGLQAAESEIAMMTLLLMNQELSRNRVQLEERLRETRQEES